MKASIRQISEMTGFSPATVSNALNNKRGVNPETAAKILEAAHALSLIHIFLTLPKILDKRLF